ncbi:hypothetical protein G7054_g6667 [Neopestalotiopsis clavispora]|nr:hypothetical protein G7054_g6667 [Neopestalotiopsis clavispora]
MARPTMNSKSTMRERNRIAQRKHRDKRKEELKMLERDREELGKFKAQLRAIGKAYRFQDDAQLYSLIVESEHMTSPFDPHVDFHAGEPINDSQLMLANRLQIADQYASCIQPIEPQSDFFTLCDDISSYQISEWPYPEADLLGEGEALFSIPWKAIDWNVTANV